MGGRGRGRGRAPPTGGRLFAERSAEECGLDARNLNNNRPELFPEILLHSSGDNKLLQTMEEDALKLQEQQQQQQQQKQQQQQQKDIAAGGVKVENDGSSPSDNNDNNITPQKKLSGTKRSSQTLFLITKGREIHHRIQNSAYYVKNSKVPDITRYSDFMKPPPTIDASTVLSHCLRGRKRTKMGYYIPEELVSGQKLGSNTMSNGIEASIAAGKAVNLADLEARPTAENEEKGDGEGEDDEVIDDGSEEDGADYVNDYYASEGEESAGGDNELTF
jgi:hypothetical protein